MVSKKFDEDDRRKVIAEVETALGVTLSQVVTKKKYLRDAAGTTYWVFGGYDNWHGIPPDMMEVEVSRDDAGILVIAKRIQQQLTIFHGPLRPLIRNRHQLRHTQKGDFQFNIRILGRHMFIAEIPELILTELRTTPYSGDEKVGDKKVAELKAMLAKLSPDERQQLIDELAVNGRGDR